MLTLLNTVMMGKAVASCEARVESCENALRAADAYILELNYVIGAKNSEIEKYEKLSSDYEELNKELQLAEDEWYESPYLWGALGLVIGYGVAK